MARAGLIQNSFAQGELSPRLYGRTDLQQYAVGAAKIEGFLVRPEGGLTRRHGTRFAGETKLHAKFTQLVPFVVAQTLAYQIEFGDQFIRFWRNYAPITSSTKTITGITQANPGVVTATAHGFSNGDRVVIAGVGGMGQVNNREFEVANQTANTFELLGVNTTSYDAYTSGGTASKIVQISSPYLEADLSDLQTTQSADTLYIVHPNYQPRTLVRTSDTIWALTATTFAKGPFAPQNSDDTSHILCTVTGSNYDPGDSVTVYSNKDIFASGHVGGYMYFEERYPADNDISPWSAAAGAIPAVGDQVSNAGHVYEVVETLGNSYGTVGPTHTDGEAWDASTTTSVRKKFRYLHSRWAIVEITAFTNSKQVSATIRTRLPNGLAPVARTITATANSGGRIRITSTAHGFGVGDYVRIEGVTGTTEANGDWRVINTAANTFELEGSTYTNAYVSGGTAKRFPTWLWRHSAFSAARGWPRAVCIHEQRLCFANTILQPFGFWASKAGSYDKFLPGALDSDSIGYNVASNKIDPIQWMESGNNLVLGTLSQELAAFGGGLGDPITPANTRIVPQSGEGSENTHPEKAGTDIIFINRAGRKLFALGYSSDVDSYVSVDLLELAEHLTEVHAITHLAWAKNPLSIMWALRADGTLLAMTYRRDQRVIAWAPQPLNGGVVECISVIPSPDGKTDDLWMVVRRTINGQTRRYVEYLAQPFIPTTSTDKALMGFVDCALRYSGTPATVISGLFHLEGQTVQIVADGAVRSPQVVSGGKITLDAAALSVWVGCGYTSRLHTLRLEVPAMGTAQAKTGRTSRATVRVHNSMGGKIGYLSPGSVEGDLNELIQRALNDPMDASSPLTSGDVDAYIGSDFDTARRLAVIQDEPLPLDILAIMPMATIADG